MGLIPRLRTRSFYPSLLEPLTPEGRPGPPGGEPGGVRTLASGAHAPLEASRRPLSGAGRLQRNVRVDATPKNRKFHAPKIRRYEVMRVP
jgi:hypothetical protein